MVERLFAICEYRFTKQAIGNAFKRWAKEDAAGIPKTENRGGHMKGKKSALHPYKHDFISGRTRV